MGQEHVRHQEEERPLKSLSIVLFLAFITLLPGCGERAYEKTAQGLATATVLLFLLGLVEQLQTLRAVFAILIEPRCSFPARDGPHEP